MPRVQEILKSVTGQEELHVHLNGDEAMCFGSAFIVSNFTSSFKVKHFYLTQHPKYDVQIKISPLSGDAPEVSQVDGTESVEVSDGGDGEDGEAQDMINYYREVTLFSREHYLGQRKTMNIVYDRGMKIEATALHYGDDGETVIREEELVVFKLPELDDIAEYDVVKKEDTTKPKVSL